MRVKTLLFVLLTSIGMAQAQDTIRSLIITEACMRSWPWAYLELTNMGDENVQLADFTVGKIEPWENPLWTPRSPSRSFRLPERVLNPGESFLIVSVWDYSLELHAKGVNIPGSGSAEVMHKKDLEAMADMQVHMDENGEAAADSVDFYDATMEVGNGRDTWFLQYHLSNGDSVVIDQVGGVFDGENGLNLPFDSRYGPPSTWGYDVAGVQGATFSAHLIRKYSVKTGNLDFANARGVGTEDSEWIAIPVQSGAGYWTTDFRKALWTAGNHVNASLNENTLESDVIEVDFPNKKLIIPWGIRRNDDIMNYFVKKPGIGWNYHRAPNSSVEDSLSFAAKTGDMLELWVCGDDMSRAIFEIEVMAPNNDAKLAVPKLNQDPEGNWRNNLGLGMLTWPRVTQHESGMDTIWGEWGGIPYQTRIDSLMKRMEIPSNATWELVTADGVKRPDIKESDILKVIAENGTDKEYYISVNEYSPSHNALLSAITWPDMPDFYRGIFGWKGDTIPNFVGNVYNYKVTVPMDVNGIPGLIAKTEDLNAQIEVVRASSLRGTTEDRTVKFIVTAEDDTTVNTYNVELIKEKSPDDIQPFNPDPFISEFVFKNYWANSFMEIYNPGNQPVDLSNYMFVGEFGDDPVFAISNSTAPHNFRYRYKNYIPGYKYTNEEAKWTADPGLLEPDLNVYPVVMPGEVFVMADIRTGSTGVSPDVPNIEFNKNPWGANIGDQRNAINHWAGNIWMFKILNDSIKRGLKAPNDINDFELIDAFSIKYANYIESIRRKPEIWKGNPILEDSQKGENKELEWIIMDPSNFNGSFSAVSSDIGQHFYIPPTHYMSTVGSLVYKVSEGYTSPQEIRGVTTNTTVSNFLANIVKADKGQTLTVTSFADGIVLSMDALLSLNDTLTVLSADSINTTKYVLEVSENGLSSDAKLTSTRYEITIDAEPKSAGDAHTPGSGSITGFEYGTTLQTIVNNVTVPAGATMNVITGDGAYVPFKQLNFDTAYVSVTVNADTYFEVLAENGVTTITYQLLPRSSESEAFVLSDLYSVSQANLLIDYVPRGTNVQSFLANLVPSMGASMKLVDKWGLDRMDGTVADDDKLVVTSPDGTTTKVYHISKLATEFVPVTSYLAYILSNHYGIDQVEYVIHGASGIADISEFYSRIRIVQGATAVVVDMDGNEKTNGKLNRTDMVKVTSADGKIVVFYSFGNLTSVISPEKIDITLYPNPTNGKLNISGLQPGGRIQIFNSIGEMMQIIKVKQSLETISLENYSSGIYFVITSDSDKITSKNKVVKF